MGKGLGATRRVKVGNGNVVSERRARDPHQTCEQQDLLLNEIRHRVRNLAAIMDALGRGSLPENEPVTAAFFETFMARVRALLSVGEMVISSSERQANLDEIARLALQPFLDSHAGRFRFGGPKLLLSEAQAGGIALAMHELATNSLKYGALRDPDGTIDLIWTVISNQIEIVWKEHVAVPIQQPNKQGFGSRLITRALASERDSKTAMIFERDGLKCILAFAGPGFSS